MPLGGSQFTLYNDALVLCGERLLANPTENRESRFYLDQIWSSGAQNACLEAGFWEFAARAIKIGFDPSFSPQFGYNRVFGIPADFIKTISVCEEEFFRVPLTRYREEAGFWYAEMDTIFVIYVSNDPAYGGTIGNWPRSFYDFVAAHLASKLIFKLSRDEEEWKKIQAVRKDLLTHAKNEAAFEEPTSFLAQGSWTRARQRFLNRRDAGNTSGSLIG